MAKNNNDRETRPRIEYEPEWMTKSIDKLPPSEGPLAPNIVFEQLVALGRENGRQGTQNGDSEAPNAPNENPLSEQS